MGSYEQINYSLRPAKSIERKMLCEAMKKLSTFEILKNYLYIGFGSTYFSDFNLIHKTLGLRNLISLEKDAINSERFNFNKPFSCVKTVFSHSNDALPMIEWKTPAILWLDYDDPLNASMFLDIGCFFSKAVSGSMFIISLNVQPETFAGESLEKLHASRIKSLENKIGKDKLPIDIDSRSLSLSGLPNVIYEIINDQIREELKKRNGGAGLVMNWNQLFHFIYKDGAQMLTIGGVLNSQADQDKFASASFSELSFIRDNDSPFKITVPNLTFKEIRALDSNLPDNINLKTGRVKTGIKNYPNLKKSDIENYAKLYRYFPNFAEANF